MRDHPLKHRAVVLGAGCAGSYMAGILARRVCPEGRRDHVVSAEEHFVQRLQMHRIDRAWRRRPARLGRLTGSWRHHAGTPLIAEWCSDAGSGYQRAREAHRQ